MEEAKKYMSPLKDPQFKMDALLGDRINDFFLMLKCYMANEDGCQVEAKDYDTLRRLLYCKTNQALSEPENLTSGLTKGGLERKVTPRLISETFEANLGKKLASRPDLMQQLLSILTEVTEEIEIHDPSCKPEYVKRNKRTKQAYFSA